MKSRKRLLKKVIKKGKDLMGELTELGVTEKDALNTTAELNEKIKGLEEENKNLKDKSLRLYADYENLKKRVSKEKEDFISYANERIIKELLPVIDNFERAIYTSNEHSNFEGLLDGVKLNCQSLIKVIEKFGVAEVDAGGKVFDPNFHEAMNVIETAEYEPNMVIEQLQKGYVINGKLIRPALVVVSKLPPEEKIEKNGTDS